MSDIEIIRENIDRYHQLRIHTDRGFRKKIKALHKWKTDISIASYVPLMENRAERNLLAFYFKEVFTGVDLSELKNPRLAIKFIDKFFSGTEMVTLAMQFNTVTGEVDQKVTETLFYDMDVKELNEKRYIEACHRADVLDAMEERKGYLEGFIKDLNEVLDDRLIRSTIKFTAVPARLAGFKRMHSLISHGFSYSRKVDDAQSFAQRIVNHEREVLNNIRNQTLPAFFEIE